MKSKRVVGALLASLMAVSAALSGCAQEQPAQSSGGASAPEGESQAEASQSDSGEKAKITVSIYDRGTLDPSEGTMEDNRWTKWINENAPVEVEFVSVPRWTSTEKFNALFASGSAPDLILDYTIPTNWVTDGLLMPLDDVVEQYSTEYKNLLEQYPAMKKAGTVNGQMYYLTTASPLQPNHMLLIRNDWLEAMGMEVPKTEEEFYEVAVAFAQNDPDGNGQDDTYGMSLSFVSGFVIDQMYGLQNDGFVVEDGQFQFAWDRLEACYNLKKRLYDSGAVNKDFAADTSGEQSYQDFVNGKLGMIGLSLGSYVSMRDFTKLFFENNPDGDFQVIELPSTSIGTFGACLGGSVGVFGAINADCENPGAVMQYIDWMNSSPDIYNTLSFGGEEYATCNENGVWVSKDPERSKKEVYGGDFILPVSKFPLGIIERKKFDKDNEMEAIALQKFIDAETCYCKDEYPYQQNYAEPRPALDAELSVILTNTYSSATDGPIKSNLSKAIMGGSEYTVEQAIADCKQLCEDGNGQKLVDFYTQWYEENKDSLITDAERYSMYSTKVD